MSTNRPFFSNFFSAFRARSGFQKASSSPTGGVSGASLTKAQQAAAASTSARAAASSTSMTNNGITPTQSQIIPSAPLASATSPRKATTTTSPISVPGVTYQRHHHTSPYSRSPGTSPGPARGFRSGSITPSANNNTVVPMRRRGSDSSSEGFREILGAEKWYIGGRTATGEERFYRLGMVRRPPSIDRLSADRLSL